MTATLIDLRNPHQASDDLPGLRAVLAQQLTGEPFLFAAAGYADEMVLHFGRPREYSLPKFGKQVEGSHVLSLRGSAWLLKSGPWPLAVGAGLVPPEMPTSFGQKVKAEDLKPGVFVEEGARVVGATPFLFRPAGGFGLQLFLSDGSQLTVIPTPDEGEGELTDWELISPHGVLRIGPGPKWGYEPTETEPNTGATAGTEVVIHLRPDQDPTALAPGIIEAMRRLVAGEVTVISVRQG